MAALELPCVLTSVHGVGALFASVWRKRLRPAAGRDYITGLRIR